MPKKSSGSGRGYGCLLVIGILLIVGLWQKNPTYGMVAVGVLVVIGLLAAVSGSGKKDQCEVCGNPTRGTTYTWTIKGKESQVCSKCNQQLERRQSKQAVDQLLDEEK